MHLLAQFEQVIAAFILLTAFLLLTKSRIHDLINTFAMQSFFVALVTAIEGILIADSNLYLSALLTFALKVIFVPWLIRRLVVQLNIRHKVATIAHPFVLLMGAIILVLFCYYLLTPIKTILVTTNNHVIAIAMAVMLLGMLLLITHRKAVSHVIGFMAMENGIFFAALVATHGMPMVVELGVAFDVLVAAVLFGVIFFHIRSSIDTLDVDRLNLLREDQE